MPYRASKNCSELLDMTQTCPTKMLKIARHDLSWPEKTAKNCSKVVKIAQNWSNLLKTAQNCPKFLKMFHNGPAGVSRGDVLAYNYRCEKLSLLGIEVAGVYCCMGLRSVSIEPRSCLLLHSEPSIVSLN